jgi:hypothetical protein
MTSVLEALTYPVLLKQDNEYIPAGLNHIHYI